MLKLLGAAIIAAASLGAGMVLVDSARGRIKAIEEMADFVEHISMNIRLYRTPLEDIYSEFRGKYLEDSGFLGMLAGGADIYESAVCSGLLKGDDEDEIIKSFGERIGCGYAEDMEKLCTYTASRLRCIAERLRSDLPDKQKIYRTISVLAGVSVIVMLL